MKPYYQDDACMIYHGDCREILPSLPKVDLVLTDPPYFVPAVHHATREGTSKSWGNLSILEHFFKGFFEELQLLPSATLYVFCNGQSYPLIYRAGYNRFKSIHSLIWDKGVGINGYYWRRQHEIIAFCQQQDSPLVPTGDGDVLRESCVPIDERIHDAEKPVSLMRRIILKGQNNTVLDPFMGSGTTLRAAKDLNRKSIGIEIEEKYCEIAAKRLAQEVLPMFDVQTEISSAMSLNLNPPCTSNGTNAAPAIT